ncbi:MAG: glycosyltransferase family 9 protein [Thermodesulfobacteriota bacterium]
MPAPERVLVVRLSAIGDVVNTLPAVTLLRRALPDALIGFAVEDRAKDVIVGHPLIDRVHVFPRRRWRALLRRPDPRGWLQLAREVRAYAREIRGERYDVVLDEQSNLKGAVHALASGAPRRIGFARGFDYELNHLLSTEQVTPPAARLHRVDKFVSLLGALGIDGDAREYVLPRDAAAAERVAKCLTEAGLEAKHFVVLHPGTSDHGADKRWPVERFAALARLVDERLGRPVVVTWGPGEEELARRVAALSGGAAQIAPRTASLLELVELIRRAAVFVSADTGPMHLAAAAGVPCVALFGPKDPVVYGPYGAGHVVVRPAQDGQGGPPMLRIAPQDVFAAVAAKVQPG